MGHDPRFFPFGKLKSNGSFQNITRKTQFLDCHVFSHFSLMSSRGIQSCETQPGLPAQGNGSSTLWNTNVFIQRSILQIHLSGPSLGIRAFHHKVKNELTIYNQPKSHVLERLWGIKQSPNLLHSPHFLERTEGRRQTHTCFNF